MNFQRFFKRFTGMEELTIDLERAITVEELVVIIARESDCDANLQNGQFEDD